jgi:hypothetical protein
MASRKTTDLAAELDAERLAQLEESLAAERERRDAEWTRERIAAGHVTRLVCDLRIGETEEGVIAAHKAAHPEDRYFIVRMIYDAPPALPEAIDGWRRPARPADGSADRLADEERSRTERALDRPIYYPKLGVA